jgi:hypothetical protein
MYWSAEPMNLEEAKKRLSELRIEEEELFAKMQETRARWLSITALGHSLKSHEQEHRNAVAQ